MERAERIPFVKMTGSGNDFILVDNRNGLIKPEEGPLFAKKVCRRKLSVGADGLILIEKDGEVDFSWRFYNSDGSEAEMCGNGARCAARFAVLKGIVDSPSMTFRTLAGLIKAEVAGERVRVQIPELHGLKLNIDLRLDENRTAKVHFVNSGVPHVVWILDTKEELEKVDVVGLGRRIRFHENFSPAGTNANFIWVQDRQSVVIRTYERGVEDETLACGTGSIAAAAITVALGLTDPPVSLVTRGGEILRVFFEYDDGRFENLFLEGPALVVYEGSLWDETVR
ncbi:diaminopimelate epimerase [Thermodesulforhabdus norvegica]|uniref:Diaminopimelate epimerase n=1 Tax=Thermodesulforhabdus norvegica TaxID=39841 RepID=A0A1I4W4X1_9BACT|nr:diaminopimelate epimerase [Thermodesulforhabdus norvegica]SFN08601.1 diaminopimelate epimerase [Thermodesulforhabdus norvegica]